MNFHEREKGRSRADAEQRGGEGEHDDRVEDGRRELLRVDEARRDGIEGQLRRGQERERVDTGRYSTAYAYMRLSKAIATPRPAQRPPSWAPRASARRRRRAA
jgi:hypothetical protein